MYSKQIRTTGTLYSFNPMRTTLEPNRELRGGKMVLTRLSYWKAEQR
jgi:hypothetical protein